ncbi:hypothetical protein BCT81_05390 [Vibrio sp. 10N.261.52.A1]|nr:hypothetical protein BCT81_05390 [Vibrio sp. 10N.261.52.A1]
MPVQQVDNVEVLMTSRKLSAGGWLATEMSFKDVGIGIYAGANTWGLASRGAGARFIAFSVRQ